MEPTIGGAEVPAEVLPAGGAIHDLPGVAREPCEIGARVAVGLEPFGDGEAADSVTKSPGILAVVLVAAGDLDARRVTGDGRPAGRASEDRLVCYPRVS